MKTDMLQWLNRLEVVAIWFAVLVNMAGVAVGATMYRRGIEAEHRAHEMIARFRLEARELIARAHEHTVLADSLRVRLDSMYGLPPVADERADRR